MDESWRVPIGSVVPRRRSAEQTRRAGGSLGADDFRDVFGGPPRSVLVRQFSGIDTTSLCSSPPYLLDADIHRDPKAYSFRPPRGDSGPQHGGGRWVVRTEGGFYNDIFESVGGKGDRIGSRIATPWRSTSKSNSSSVVSSEDGSEPVGRLRAPIVDDADAALSSFAAKLSPIIVPSRRRGATPSPAIMSMGEQSSGSGSWRASSTAPCPRPCFGESRLEDILILTRPKGDGDPHGRRFGPYTPPDAVVGLDHVVTGNDDSGSGGSPSSAVSSIYDDIPMATIIPVGAHDRLGLHGLEKPVSVVMEDEEEEESYGVIEIVPGGTATDPEGVGAVDEAIAWAKEKFRGGSSSPAETGVADGELKQGARREEEHEQEEGLLGSRDDGMLDVVTHVERLRGGWR